MTHDEQVLFTKYTKGVGTYLEWGSGGSSATFALQASHTFSVDSFPVWCDKVRNDPCVRSKSENFSMHCVEHPNTIIQAWGMPAPADGQGGKPFFHSYGEAYVVDSVHSLNVSAIDFAFIDGRYRVACALHALSLLSPGGKIGIHDYSGRSQYHILEKFYKTVAVADTAVIMEPIGGETLKKQARELLQSQLDDPGRRDEEDADNPGRRDEEDADNVKN